MKKIMIYITITLSILFIIFLVIFLVIKNPILETISITIGICLYHFAIRLIIGTLIDLIMKKPANYNNFWFREKKLESKFYKLIRIQKWKKYLPTYNPEQFDTKNKTLLDIIGSSCQAEVIHEIIILFSFLPIAFIPLLGGLIPIIITSILAALFDSLFVILQRYNRPRLIRVMNRYNR